MEKIRQQDLKPGLELVTKRKITRNDIENFANLTGDYGDHHLPKNGPAMAHGLFIAGLVTKLGGQINFISRRMDIEFRQPAYENETLTAKIKISGLSEKRLRYKAVLDCFITNEQNEIVGIGQTYGQILK